MAIFLLSFVATVLGKNSVFVNRYEMPSQVGSVSSEDFQLNNTNDVQAT
jgi:hypothetical protein